MTAAEFIAAKLDGRKPFVGIVLGSGLGKLAEKIENPIVIPYKEIPGFPVSTATGHKGNFIAGELGGGGHVKAAGCEVLGESHEVLEKLLGLIKKQL